MRAMTRARRGPREPHVTATIALHAPRLICMLPLGASALPRSQTRPQMENWKLLHCEWPESQPTDARALPPKKEL